MCEKSSADFETFNPEVEFQKFLKRKPIVNTAKIYGDIQKPEQLKCPYNFQGYGVENEDNIMYRTCNSDYGYYAPNAFTFPHRYYPLPQKFSNEISRFGMYRNFSLNTNMDRTFY